MPLKTINIENHAYFVTSKVYRNINLFIYEEFCNILIDNLNFYRNKFKVKILGYVIMLDHLHTIIWPQGKDSISDIMRDFKKQTAKEIIKIIREGGIRNPAKTIGRIANPTFSEILETFTVNTQKQTYKLWQSRNWIENIYSVKFLKQKLNYIHLNPVRAKLVKNAADYKYSSYRNYYFKW